MKKYLLSILALVGLFATSCSNDDIVVESNNSIEFTVNTSDLYKTFDIEDEIEDAIRDKKQCITVTNLIYDNESGTLVKEIKSSVFALNNIKESIELNSGAYTIISVQSLGNPNKDGNYARWEISDKENLSSVNIKPNSKKIYFLNVIGVSTKSITVNGKETITITPEAIGSLVNIYYCNFDLSNYVNLGFYTKDITTKYLLDPSVTRDNRFVIDLSSSGQINIREERENAWEEVDNCTLYLLENRINFCGRM